jgi:putative hydrolase of the HAD superfamily
MQKRYENIFFDLDRTLWDFDKSAQQTFKEIYLDYDLKNRGINSFKEFTIRYNINNDMLWGYYRRGEIKKEILSVQRWELTLQDFNIEDIPLAEKMSEHYLSRSPLKVNLFDYSHEILQYLNGKYSLHIITNGFEEVQYKKLAASDLRKYFKTVVTSEEAGCKKPEAGIFEFAMQQAGGNIQNSIMVGDDLSVDILGAKKIEMDQIFVNHVQQKHTEQPTYEVYSLKEIEKIL